MFSLGLRVGTIFTIERYKQIAIVTCGESDGGVAWLFCITCFPVGSATKGELLKEQWLRGLGTTVCWKVQSTDYKKHKVLILKVSFFFHLTCPSLFRLVSVLCCGFNVRIYCTNPLTLWDFKDACQCSTLIGKIWPKLQFYCLASLNKTSCSPTNSHIQNMYFF